MPSTNAAAVRNHYDTAAVTVPELTVLNYGFSSEPESSVIEEDEPEFYCLRLYEHAVRDTPLMGRDVLEVSCGRGGGASFVHRTFKPRRYVGIDLSEQNVELARKRCAGSGIDFRVGLAERLELPDASFDVVINIEASHLYEDRARFFTETFRVLKPGGRFCYTDGCWADDDCTDELLEAGFEVIEREEITPNVMRALRLDNARREALFDQLPDDATRRQYKDWGGVVGFRAYERFAAGQTRYYSQLLRRPG